MKGSIIKPQPQNYLLLIFIGVYYIEFPIRIRGFPSEIHYFLALVRKNQYLRTNESSRNLGVLLGLALPPTNATAGQTSPRRGTTGEYAGQYDCPLGPYLISLY